MHSYKFLPAFLLVCGSCLGFCQKELSDPASKQICASVKDVQLPAADRPTAAEAKALSKCSSVNIYFGFGEAADPVKARKCAYAEIDRGDKDILGGKAMLMAIYANARGVPRNFDIALNLACAIGGEPGDAAGRIRQLDRMKKSNWTGDNFGICGHSSGHDLYQQCVILTERFDKIERDQKFNDLTAKWNPAEKKAFHTFRDEAEKFFLVQAANGVDLEGSFEIQEQVFQRNNLLTALQQLESGELPKYTEEEFRRAEAAESAAYARTQTGNVPRWGTITPESVKKSEEAWRRYCNDWIAFGKRKYPTVSEASWKAWLDQDRIGTFNRFLH
ncbi:MAG TPA: hypothetical protein VIB39_04025 [Candidatus Angelobacter sp.]|jgi:hypothetical protein